MLQTNQQISDWKKNAMGREEEREQQFKLALPHHTLHDGCFDPTSSWNFFQLNIAGTRSGSYIHSFLHLFCLFLLLIPSPLSFEQLKNRQSL